MVFDSTFYDHLDAALTLNGSVHDGAVMAGRDHANCGYRITGWSYRLFPPPYSRVEVNRGSAFNSCLAMSVVRRVDRLYLVSQNKTYQFLEGSVREVSNSFGVSPST
jgi:hypothetical protein